MRGYVFLLLFGLATPAFAQQAPRDSAVTQDTLARSPSVDRRAWLECNPGSDLVRSELLGLDRHAGWGLFLGAVTGVVYGAATTGQPARGAVMIFDGFLGAGAGFAIGSAVYIFRRATGYKPAIRARCGERGRNGS